MEGFFGASAAPARKPLPLFPACYACRLCETAESPFMKPHGQGKKGILVVGEAPGRTEDEKGRPFVGPAGRRLREGLARAGVDLDRDCWATNALVCRSPDNKIANPKSVEYCRPNLLNTIDDLKPTVIVLLGLTAVRSLVGWLWKENVGDTGRWVGWRIPLQRFNAWACPTWHPSYVMRQEYAPLDLHFDRHLAEAAKLDGRPWDTVPDFAKQVIVIHDLKRIDQMIGWFTNSDRPVAFDFETDCLKPDRGGRIVCCAMSDGTSTIAFPWHGKDVVRAFKEFVRSNVPKIASNLKFEDRWVRKVLGVPVRNWHTDTMLAAHVLDNRPQISGLKFQAFALLGQEAYDEAVRPYLQSKEEGGYARNRTGECPVGDLLQYCGMDALLEWHVAARQRKLLNGG